MTDIKKNEKLIITALVSILVLAISALIYVIQVPADEIEPETLLSGSETAAAFDEEYWMVFDTDQASENAPGQELEASGTGDYGLHAVVLDVGQGSAAVFESNGEYLVVDTGDPNHAQIIVSYMKSKAPEEIKYLCLTHYDADHIGGAVGLLLNFSTSEIWKAPYEAEETRTYISLLNTFAEYGLNAYTPAVGTEYILGECTVKVIGPLRTYEEENANSLALLITAPGGKRILIAGDMTIEAENGILQAGTDIEADVYIVSHHGSSSSSGEDFVRAMDPEYSIISCDSESGYGHPTKKVLGNLKDVDTKLYRTDTQGDIAFTISKSGEIEFEREPADNWEPGEYDPGKFTINNGGEAT